VDVGVGIFSILAVLVVVAFVAYTRRRRAYEAGENEPD
jgi:type II secretory pathway pseudopilin PulG